MLIRVCYVLYSVARSKKLNNIKWCFVGLLVLHLWFFKTRTKEWVCFSCWCFLRFCNIFSVESMRVFTRTTYDSITFSRYKRNNGFSRVFRSYLTLTDSFIYLHDGVLSHLVRLCVQLRLMQLILWVNE